MDKAHQLPVATDHLLGLTVENILLFTLEAAHISELRFSLGIASQKLAELQYNKDILN
jgi:hypothetical protein